MEIVLATVAMEIGLIGERVFVALVIMALVTSILSGPLMRRALTRRQESLASGQEAPVSVRK
ncbi:MAG: hypothetical protein C0404_03775 [Verrucomicrobia bacterium]|nr:hypothetical protein [Verrucomicrobiota bacterium]